MPMRLPRKRARVWFRQFHNEVLAGLTVAAICSLASFSWTEWGFNTKIREEGSKPVQSLPAQVNLQGGPLPQVAPAWQIVPDRDFDLFILTGEYHWQFESTVVLGPGGREVGMAHSVNELVGRLSGRNYGHLIVVGTASCEGDVENENDRAKERALQLVELLRGPAEERDIHILNLGKFRDCRGRRNTASQRRILLAAEKTPSCPADLRERLYELFQRKSLYGLAPDDYSVFELDYQRSR